MQKLLTLYSKYIILAFLLYQPIYGHLDTLPIRRWDESRLAINAYEMLTNGDFIVTHYNGKPDMWNTKPPLLIWIQVFFMKIIGVNELAVRLPSAIAAFFTCIGLLLFFIRYLKNFWFGFITVFVLITSQGYINFHASRTGDYDALLTLFTTLSGLLFFSFCETKKYKYLYLFFLCTALAVLTKSIAGLLFLPAILLYSLIQKQFIPLLKSKHFYFGSLLFLVLVVGYYLLREVNNPGYFAAVQENELGGRYLNVLEEHQHGFWYYYDNFIDFQLPIWYLLVPCGLMMGLVSRDKKINKVTLFSALMIITYFLLISSAQTKLGWYDVPMYPFLAILIAVFIHYIFNLLQDFKWINQTLMLNIAPFIFLFLIGITPYQKILDKTYFPKEYGKDIEFYEIGYFLKDAINGKYNLNNHYLLFQENSPQNLFYIIMLNQKGVNISSRDWKKIAPLDVVITYQKEIKKYIEETFAYEIIHSKGNVTTYKILRENDHK